jgi:hypothetical protein
MRAGSSESLESRNPELNRRKEKKGSPFFTITTIKNKPGPLKKQPPIATSASSPSPIAKRFKLITYSQETHSVP